MDRRLELNKNYTLIIPTFNRPQLLNRLVMNLTNDNVNFQVIVLDSSDESDKLVNSMLCNQFTQKIKYFQYSADMPPNKKILNGLEKVSTEYVSICGDDDFVFTDTIQECVKFLSIHADYVACHGYYFNFRRLSNNHFFIGHEYYTPSISCNLVSERILQLMRNFESLFYAVFRTSVIRSAFEKVYNTLEKKDTLDKALSVDSPMFQELFLSLTPLGAGKIKRLSNIFCARSNEAWSESGSALLGEPNRYTRWHPGPWFADNPQELFTKYLKYRDLLIECLSNYDQSLKNDDDGRKLLDLIHGIFFMKSISQDYILRTIYDQYNFHSNQWTNKLSPSIIIRNKWLRYIVHPELLSKALFKNKFYYFFDRIFKYKNFKIKLPSGDVYMYKVSYDVLLRINYIALKKALKYMTCYLNESKK